VGGGVCVNTLLGHGELPRGGRRAEGIEWRGVRRMGYLLSSSADLFRAVFRALLARIYRVRSANSADCHLAWMVERGEERTKERKKRHE